MATTLRLGIGGLGAIGLAVARKVDAGGIEGITLAAVSARDQEKAKAKLAGLRSMPHLVSLAELSDHADVVLEAVPARHFAEIAEPAIAKGRIFMPLSVGQLLGHMHLVDRARATGGRILVPTGALLGPVWLVREPTSVTKPSTGCRHMAAVSAGDRSRATTMEGWFTTISRWAGAAPTSARSRRSPTNATSWLRSRR